MLYDSVRLQKKLSVTLDQRRSDAFNSSLAKIENALNCHKDALCSSIKGATTLDDDLPFFVVNHLQRYSRRFIATIEGFVITIMDANADAAALCVRAYLETTAMLGYIMYLLDILAEDPKRKDEILNSIKDMYKYSRITALKDNPYIVESKNILTIIQKANTYCNEYVARLHAIIKEKHETEDGRKYFERIGISKDGSIAESAFESPHDLLERYEFLSELCHPNALPFIFYNNIFDGNIASYPESRDKKCEQLINLAMTLNYLVDFTNWIIGRINDKISKHGALPELFK